MPVKNGFDATSDIRKIYSEKYPTHKTIIMALSASLFTEDLQRQCKDSGFDGTLSSPVELIDIKRFVLGTHFS